VEHRYGGARLGSRKIRSAKRSSAWEGASEDQEGALGFLYVDGHVRVYNGKRKLPKAYVTRRRLAMPATTDYWVHDREGDLVLVITAPADEGLVERLGPILEEIKALAGEGRVLTIVFDRGGWNTRSTTARWPCGAVSYG